jgi:hypothetical protein
MVNGFVVKKYCFGDTFKIYHMLSLIANLESGFYSRYLAIRKLSVP